MRSKLLVSLLTLVVAVSVKAQNQRHELGIILGEPTGLSYKYWLSTASAIHTSAAWSFFPDQLFDLHTDYQIHLFNTFTMPKGSLPVFFGAGITLRAAADRTVLGLRAITGLNYYFEKVPIALFCELAPRFDLIPTTGAGLNGGIGIRYCFNPQSK